MATSLEIAAKVSGDGMPLGNDLALPIRKDQVELQPGGVGSPEMDDDAAGTVVWQDYQRCAQWIDTNSWLAEWQYTDFLYQSPSFDRNFRTDNREVRVSSFIVAKNRNTMSPQVKRGLFGDGQPFVLEPRGKLAGMPEEISETILNAWTELFSVLSDRADFEYQMSLAIECQVLQGTMICVPGWEERPVLRKSRHRRKPPVSVDMPAGPPRQVNTWESDDFIVREKKVKESWPSFEFRELGTTMFADTWRTPGRPDLTGVYRIDVDYVTLQDLQQMRELDCYKDIPGDEDLKTFFFETSPRGDAPVGTATAQSMNSQSTLVLHAAGEQTNVSEDPSLKPLQKIARWTRDRVCEVLCYQGRRKVIRNEAHGLGDHALGYSATWWNVPKCGYGLGQGRLNAGDQRIEGGVTNTSLRMIGFPFNAPLLYDRSAGNAPTQNMIVGLGQLLGIDTGPSHDINKAFGFMKMPEIPPEAWKFLDLAHRGGENKVGADSIAMQGNVNTPGSSAMRTATGVQRAGGKADETVSDPIAHLEGVVERWLMFLWDRVLEDMPIAEIREILSDKYGEAILDQIDAEEFLNAKFEIRILAGQKLAAKAAILQLIPFLLQIVQQPQLMQWLHEKGWTINFKSIEDVFQRMSELQSWQDIFVPLSDQEKQMVQQMSAGAQKVQAGVAVEKVRGQNKLQQVQAQGTQELQNTLVEKALDKIGPQELAEAEGRLQRNTDMGELQQGIGGPQ
ncbi:MAG: hypothetical protein WBQ94_04415 [Terracidiphilus sp.]